MTPLKFVDRKFQEIVIRGQAGKFSLVNDAEQNALKFILGAIRLLSAAPFIPIYLIEYFLVLARIRKAPEPRLEQLGEQVAAEKAADHHRKTGGKSFGFVKGAKK